MKNKIFAILVSTIIIFPAVTAAAGLIPCTGTAESPCDFNAVTALINNALDWFIKLSASVAAITFTIAGGQILLNPEKPAEIQKGWDMLKKTVIGMLIVLGAWLVMTEVIGAITNSETGALRFFGK